MKNDVHEKALDIKEDALKAQATRDANAKDDLSNI